MKITNALNDSGVLAEAGQRLAQCRIGRQMTQAQLADKAGLSKRTVERLEGGFSVQADSLIRVLRVLELLEGFNRLLPESGPTPIELLKGRKRARKRASPAGGAGTVNRKWVWGEDARTRPSLT